MRLLFAIVGIAIGISLVITGAQFALQGFPVPSNAFITATSIKAGITGVCIYLATTYKSYES